ncbi:hypothetical protein [Paenibacillus sp. GP183]|jgi:hypothetical protein|uniref:hypothetical protein n=1 Tax=Paenibacillus sp. GP183 TaxID=1882751 RepID=UPI00089A368F|nr:hypothetical protein [Paenibacillus sp. GP183]SEB51089.1 hypothetical protein SAMN05443246_0783 [Paenibacillus sp. GP183]
MQPQTSPTQQHGQAILEQPPQVITTKDFLYLKDQLSWELLAMKKCHHFAQECSDPDIRQAIDEAGQMHQRHYQLFLKHMQNNNTVEMSNVQQLQEIMEGKSK